MSFIYIGGVSEWFMVAVLKIAVALRVTGGSNPSPSASLKKRLLTHIQQVQRNKAFVIPLFY